MFVFGFLMLWLMYFICHNFQYFMVLSFHRQNSIYFIYSSAAALLSFTTKNKIPLNYMIVEVCWMAKYRSGPSCSKLTTSLVNVSLKFQTLILQIHCYFLLKKCENPLQ